MGKESKSGAPTFNFGNTTGQDNMSESQFSFNLKPDTKKDTPIFSFGSASNSNPSEFKGFGLRNNEEGKSTFSFGKEKPAAIAFGTTEKKEEQPAVAFGNTEKEEKKPLFGSNSDVAAPTPSFGFGTGKEANKSMFTFGNSKTDDKPLFGGQESKNVATAATLSFGTNANGSKLNSGFGIVTESSNPTSFGNAAMNTTGEKTFFSSTTHNGEIKPTSFSIDNSKNENIPKFQFGTNSDKSSQKLLFGNTDNGSDNLKSKINDAESAAKPTFSFEGNRAATLKDAKSEVPAAGSEEEKKPAFSIGNPKNENKQAFSFNAKLENSKPTFSYSNNKMDTKEEKKTALFSGSKEETKPATSTVDSAKDHNNSTFAFGNLKAQDDVSASTIVSKKNEKPLFSFGNVETETQPNLAPTTSSEKGSDTTLEPTINGTKTQLDSDKSRKDIKQKLEISAEDRLLKEYQAPSLESDFQDENMDISDVEQADEFFDVEVDEKTALPIRKLEFEDNIKSALTKNEHVSFSVSNKNEKGVLFVTPNNKLENMEVDSQTKLFPFDVVPQMDNSIEYKEFLNDLYKEFEPLLKDKKYKEYKGMDNEYMNIGVISNIDKNNREYRLLLRKLMSSMLYNLQKLIKNKMREDFTNFSDQWIVNYEEIINVLYLLNALHFGNENETIVLFQQWIERIDLQPDEELLQEVFKESDKPYKNSLFWSVYVEKLILRGSFSTLIEDLKVSQYEELKGNDDNLFNLIEDFTNLISSYDPIKFSSDISLFLKWKNVAVALREECRNMSTKNSIIHAEILELLNILSGSVKTIVKHSTSWYECFMGYFLFQMPSKKLVNEYIDRALDLDCYEKPIPGIESWDSICVDLFNHKYLTVIASIESLDKSIGTYTAILFEASGLLEENYVNDIPSGDLIRKRETGDNISNNIDRMIEDLSLMYLNNQDLFAIGVGILVNINSKRSRDILSEMLPTYEIKDSDDFEWVLSVCSKLKLDETMSTIQKIQGERFYEKQLIPSALKCFAEARSTDKLVSIVWKLFETVLINGELDGKLANQLFDKENNYNNAVFRQSLSPLYVLNEITKGKRDQADLWFARIVSLLEFTYLPPYYKAGLILMIYENLNQNCFSLDHLLLIVENINSYQDTIESDAELRVKSDAMYSLIVNNRPQREDYPRTIFDLLHSVRRGIAMDISFKFLEDD